MAVEYAPRGLLGVLTPQANTTVEPELMALLPPGIAMVNARMTSGKPDIVARLLDYLASLDVWTTQFANAPVGAIAFACTGASYYAGVAEEAAAVDRISAGRGVPFEAASTSVKMCVAVPTPLDPKEICPGRALAMAMKPARSRTGRLAGTTTRISVVKASETGARSRWMSSVPIRPRFGAMVITPLVPISSV